MQLSLFHLGTFPRQDRAVVVLLLHPDGWWLGHRGTCRIMSPLRWPHVTSSTGPANICFMTHP